MTETAPALPDHPGAAEVVRKAIYHDREALQRVIADLTARLNTPVDIVIWLTKGDERLGWKWPLWCTEEQIAEVLGGSERVLT